MIAKVRVVPPLKIDSARQELYARISSERAMIKSIG